jgi:hypothetical protein
VGLFAPWRVSRGLPGVRPAEVARGVTDAAGETRLPLSTPPYDADVAVRATTADRVGYAWGLEFVGEGDRRVRVRLGAEAGLAGRVAVRDGGPVAGAEVVAWFGVGQHVVESRTATDADGRFRFSGVPRGAFEGEVELRALGGRGHGEVTKTLPRSATAPEDVLLLAPATCRVRGRCEDARGSALAGAVVSAGVGPGHSVGFGKSDAAGAFEFDVPRQAWTLTATSDLADPVVRRDVVCDAEQIDVGTFVLPDVRKCSVSGRCVDTAGRPVASADVVLGIGPGHSAGWGRTDADGRFAFEARAGTWAVIVAGAVWKKDVEFEGSSLELGTLTEPPPPPR